jgi:hypothetical protein
MNKKIFIVLIVFGLFVSFGCIGGEQTVKEQNIPSGATAKVAQETVKPELPKTSLDKINDAYEQGKISKPDYIFYSMEALYEPNALPQGYAGVQITNYDTTDEIMLAIENWDSLSKEQKEKIEKWIALPDVTGAEEIELKEYGTHKTPLFFSGGDPELLKVEAIPGKAKVFGVLPSGATAADKLKLQQYMGYVAKGVQDSWTKFKDMLALEPTEEVYLFVKTVPPGMLGTAAIYPTAADPVKRCRLQIDPAQTITETRTRSVTAHELFHCYQYHIPLTNWGNMDEKWMREATATWSENVIYPAYNREWEFLDTFFKTRDDPLVVVNGNKQYSDYMFFLFLQQNNGNEWSVIKPLLATKTKGAKGALKEIENYDSKFSDFVAWNWNKDPMQKYTDLPSYPAKSINGGALQEYTLDVPGKMDVVYTIGGGGAAYQVYKIPEQNEVKKIQFYFKGHGNDQKQRRAFVKIGNHWEDQSWTYLTNKRFCLNKPEEKVTEIVLIVSDSNLNNENLDSSDYEVDTTGECPFEISGFTKITYTFNAQGSDGPATGGSKFSGTYISNDVLQYDEEYDEYRLKSRTASCSYDEFTDMKDEIYHIRSEKTGSGTTTEQYEDVSTAPLKLRIRNEDIDFILSPDFNDPKWVTYSHNVLTEISLGGSDTQTQTYKDYCSFLSSMLHLTELDADTYLQGNRLKGTKTLSTAAATSVVEFDYVLKKE